MKKRCQRCREEKRLAEYVDPVLERRPMKRGRPALSHVCQDCRNELASQATPERAR